ncbi:hypothetical protein HW115_19205 [Verrucomicrobiaceae bacterium N1E253]|uniref:Uncharacterized protein n=1 Tax=Oceaniferula marina TaxID=2748318 RepID=A0A851GRK8_9BACT|nr:hypothetical protein [Oceaniferula marina]NWK57755.1 hypothetical protein [Oceaniferula marina]
MNQYRKPINVVLTIWAISILLSLVLPFFAEESEVLQDAKNLKIQVESLKIDLDRKKSSSDVSEDEYSKINGELSVLDKKATTIIQSEQLESEWNWYSDLVVPLSSLVVAVFGLYYNNKPNKSLHPTASS